MDFLHPYPSSLLSHRLIHPPIHLPGDYYIDDQPSRFPTSSDRLGRIATSSRQPFFDPSARYDPLGCLTQDEHTITRRALFSSFTPRFFPRSVARGVLSDGTWTTQHPTVHAFLQSPSSRPSLSSKTSAAIYSLAALHVFYSPSHPSYDVFWHPDIKESTAMFVHQIVTMKPPLISTTPMTWLGVHDMLWQLTGIQKEYAKSQGGKTDTPPLVPTRRSLRKRKPVPALPQEPSTREPSEVPEPPRKKAKKTRSDENQNEKEAEPIALVVERSDLSTGSNGGPSDLPQAKPTTPSLPGTRGNADTTPSPLTVTSSLPSESQSSARDTTRTGTSRGRAKDTASKKALANSTASRPSPRHSRERSPSFSSGSSTAVSAAGNNSKRARSSSSASSTSTTVDAETRSKRKGKEKAAEATVAADEETEEDEAERRPAKTRRATAKETRSKTSRKPGGATATRSPAEIEKPAAAEAPRRARNRSGVTSSSRSRKARKS
ncbi:hypothetical protein B0F90DRAFT_1697982 [Multifurca ochricompacta]|uniref:Uncharacterized protein n=1 Tax=Multifurca ochricompacta TaxID=376703 RepID=A0AAD4QQR7_9AGAM|nr:hypothetical protein B0F90DRAFT_1697982 [Multifurca ochricompacta]